MYIFMRIIIYLRRGTEENRKKHSRKDKKEKEIRIKKLIINKK